MPSPASEDLSLGRDRRLRQSREFARVRQEGRRAVKGCLIVNWLRLPEGSTSRLGVVTGRRIGGAVVRNRARRLMREAFRGNRHLLKHPVDLVLVARNSIADKKKNAVERDLLLILKQEDLLKPSE